MNTQLQELRDLLVVETLEAQKIVGRFRGLLEESGVAWSIQKRGEQAMKFEFIATEFEILLQTVEGLEDVAAVEEYMIKTRMILHSQLLTESTSSISTGRLVNAIRASTRDAKLHVYEKYGEWIDRFLS